MIYVITNWFKNIRIKKPAEGRRVKQYSHFVFFNFSFEIWHLGFYCFGRDNWGESREWILLKSCTILKDNNFLNFYQKSCTMLKVKARHQTSDIKQHLCCFYVWAKLVDFCSNTKLFKIKQTHTVENLGSKIKWFKWPLTKSLPKMKNWLRLSILRQGDLKT